jgi:hypothetical protein
MFKKQVHCHLHVSDLDIMPVIIQDLVMVKSLLAIPQEIINTIIEAIDVCDKALLKKCTLISHSFLHPSCKQLYFFIFLNSVEDYQRLCHMGVQIFKSNICNCLSKCCILYILNDHSESLLPIL